MRVECVAQARPSGRSGIAVVVVVVYRSGRRSRSSGSRGVYSGSVSCSCRILLLFFLLLLLQQ